MTKKKIIAQEKIPCACGYCNVLIDRYDRRGRERKYEYQHWLFGNTFSTGKIAELNNSWKGGVTLHTNGYRLKRASDHPRANTQGYVPEHVLVLEQKIGRRLTDDEVPHHINGIKTDNRPENLQLVTKTEHGKLHYKDRLIDSRGRLIKVQKC